MTHPAIIELMRMLPPAGTVWPRDRQVVFMQALDATLASIYGLPTLMIWINSEGEIQIAQRDESLVDAIMVEATRPDAD